MEKHATKFEMVMNAGNARLVALNREADDYALYAPRFRNSFGTSMLARGTKAEMVALQEGRV